LESELFEYEKGVFTDARSQKRILELASGRTAFLDEIGELPLSLQAKLSCWHRLLLHSLASRQVALPLGPVPQAGQRNDVPGPILCFILLGLKFRYMGPIWLQGEQN
jgi:hypothetical protein